MQKNVLDAMTLKAQSEVPTNSNTNILHRISNKHKDVKRSIPKTNSDISPHLQKLFKAPLAQNKHKHRNTFTNKTCQAVYPETPSQAGRSQDWLLIPNPAIVNSNSMLYCDLQS